MGDIVDRIYGHDCPPKHGDVVKLGPYQFGTVVRPEEARLADENSRLRSELADALNRLARLRAGGRG